MIGYAFLLSSAKRVSGVRAQLTGESGVRLAASMPEPLGEVDAVRIESVDSRRYLKELEAVAAAGKPVFINKPCVAGPEDAEEDGRADQKLDL